MTESVVVFDLRGRGSSSRALVAPLDGARDGACLQSPRDIPLDAAPQLPLAERLEAVVFAVRGACPDLIEPGCTVWSTILRPADQFRRDLVGMSLAAAAGERSLAIDRSICRAQAHLWNPRWPLPLRRALAALNAPVPSGKLLGSGLELAFAWVYLHEELDALRDECAAGVIGEEEFRRKGWVRRRTFDPYGLFSQMGTDAICEYLP